jgi:hypothetical protein
LTIAAAGAARDHQRWVARHALGDCPVILRNSALRCCEEAQPTSSATAVIFSSVLASRLERRRRHAEEADQGRSRDSRGKNDRAAGDVPAIEVPLRKQPLDECGKSVRIGLRVHPARVDEVGVRTDGEVRRNVSIT